MANVTCTLARDQEGLITGRCTIQPSNGTGQPIVLQAQAHERQLAALVKQASPEILGRLAQSQVLQKLATAFRNYMRTGTPADRPASAPRNVEASREVLRRARNGDAVARKAVADTVAKANGGDPKAQQAAADLQAAAHAEDHPERGATAGMVDVMAQAYQVGAGGGWPPPPMSLHNFYTIGGCGLKPEDFHGRATTCQAPATSSGTGRVLIGGRPFERIYNGVRWVWRELRPQMDMRAETESFGLRDALLLGMQRMQMRGLQA